MVHVHMCTSAAVRRCQCINSVRLFLLEEHYGFFVQTSVNVNTLVYF